MLLCLGGAAVAQPDLSQPAKAPELAAFQAKVDAAATALRERDPRFKDLSPDAAQGLVEFVSGNMLFVLLHELGHAVITQMGLPVLGRMEDAADTFAVFMLLRMGSDFSHRALVDAAEGWFFAARRGQKTGQRVAYYSEHGLNEQRAFQIVCIMVGSDAEKFKDLADETNLPEDRRHSCLADYSNAVFSWNLLLEPHRRAPDQPENENRRDLRPGRGRDRVRPRDGALHPAPRNRRRARGRSTGVAAAADIGDAGLRISQRELGDSDPPGHLVLRARRRLRRALSRVRRRRIDISPARFSGFHEPITSSPDRARLRGRPHR